jgi:GTPase KRas protein
LDILDTAGQEEYNAMRDQYLRQGQGFLMVYSIDNLESFKKLKTLHNQMLRVKDEPSFPVVIVGNKSDLEELRDVQFSDGQAFARSINAPFIETSAKNRINISEPYIELVRQIDHWVQAKQREKDATSQKKQKKPSSGRRCIIL